MNQKDVTRRKFLPAMAAPAALAVQAQDRRSERPVFDTVDVLVVGGGPAGIGAALGAARAGARTLLVENHSFFGGVAAWSMGMQMNQMRPFGSPRSVVHELLIAKLAAYGEQAMRLGTHEVWCNVEYLKVAILDALDDAAVRYLVHVRAVDSLVERGHVTGVAIATKRGLMTVRARVVVDASGDADVAYFAGAATLQDAGQTMPMTLAMALTNIDHAKTKPGDVSAALRSGRTSHPLITSGFLEIKQIANSSSWWVNHAGTADLGPLDATDPEQRTKAECNSRRQAAQMIQAIREARDPAVRQIEWIAAGPQVGVRESRRVKGVYALTEEDAMSGRTFEDAVAWRSGFLDTGGQPGGAYTKMQVHDVPYRALLPEKLDGLLVAGRCISATHMAAAAGKSMGNCIATGHAAGVAAALAVKTGSQPRELNVQRIRDRLRADGVAFEVSDRGQRDLK